MKTRLFLHVKGKYFDQIKSGEKTEEYRLAKIYWFHRLSTGLISTIAVIRGYPRVSEMCSDNTMVFPWRGYERKTITHEEFGPNPVEVFAVKLEAA